MKRNILIIHIIGFILTILFCSTLIVEIVIARRAFDSDVSIFQTRLKMIIPMYRWFICWTIFYWCVFVWMIKNKPLLRNWLQPKLVYITSGLLIIFYFYNQSVFQTYNDSFVQSVADFSYWTTFIVFIVMSCFAYLFRRLSYRLNIISFAVIWIIFTCFLYVQFILFPQM